MFQRLKGAIDSRIAEEQARQRLSQASPSRSVSGAGRSSTRDESPSKRPPRTGARGRKDGDPLGKEPDPAEFEPDIVIGDDDGPSRVGTPRPAEPKKQTPSTEIPTDASSESTDSQAQEKPATKEAATSELPTDVRVKLRKLEKLESKYHELLRSYRIAHARVQTIEPFEISLRENTPLTSISDPSALVEYLNNMNLKGDMVLDELKRVSSERDSFKQELADAEKSAKEAWNEVANLRKPETAGVPNNDAKDLNSKDGAVSRESADGDPLGVSTRSPTAPVTSRKGSLASLPIFSPKSKPAESPVLPAIGQKSEDLFSFDNELTRMEAAIKDKQAKIEELQSELKTLKGDLLVTRESTQGMADSLEEATRELNMLRERRDNLESELQMQSSASQNEISQLRSDLQNAESQLGDIKTEIRSPDNTLSNDLTRQLEQAKEEINGLRAESSSEDHKHQVELLQTHIRDLEAQIAMLHADAKQSEKRVNTLNGLVTNLRDQLTTSNENSAEIQDDLKGKIAKYEAQLKGANHERNKVDQNDMTTDQVNGASLVMEPPADSNTTGKKKNKRKKKAGKSTTDTSTEATPHAKPEEFLKNPNVAQETVEPNDTLAKLQTELEQLRSTLAEKNTALEKVQRKLKDQDDLKEEIESLRDDLITVGQEHVEAKDRAKELLAEKAMLQTTVAELEKEIADLKGSNASSTAGSEEQHSELVEQFEELKRKASSLQIDLSAAEKLANTRFKDLTELRAILQKAQPELTGLRAESAEFKVVRESLGKKEAEIKRLESKQEEIQVDLIRLKRIENEQDAEIKTLREKVAQESGGRLKAEDAVNKSSQKVHDLSVEKQHATESIDRLSRDLAHAREELRTSRTRLQELEQQLSKLRNESDGLREETELKTAQYASAQSLMTSMRDQTTEMATQLKEARERGESLDEEVAEAHRLLNERTREGETMRRLLADVEGRADARTREMKERMDTAMEERERAEDEASTAGRRRAREMEEMRNKVREAERNLKRAEDDKEELENAQRDWKRRREDLEYRSEQSTREAEEVRKAMSELRDALDESERQARDLEKQKAELRRSLEETQQRLEKLQKANKSMADEIRTMQTARTRAADSEVQSSRTSTDSAPSRSRLGSPTPKHGAGASMEAANGQSPGAMDFVYLKNVLLQFLEQKDKKHQMQLIPVLGMLLHFDRKDEQKLMSAISTK